MSAPASRPGPGEVSGWSIDPGNVELVGLEFQRLDLPAPAASAPDDPVNVEFEFSAARAGPNHLAVALKVSVHATGVLQVAAQAATVLTVEHPEEPQETVDAEYAQIAAQIGPVIIYPYIRELIADLSRRTGKPPLTLPIYQIGSLFEVDPEQIRLREEPKPKKSSTRKGGSSKKPAKKTKAKS